MFGKPEWFKKKTRGWGLVPTTWQGWAYTLGAAGVIAGPFNLLLYSRGVPEALIWLGASVGFLLWEVRRIIDLIDHPAGKRDVLYIGDDDDGVDSIRTKQLEMRVRKT